MRDSEPEPAGSDVRTFLIADVRGYTRFTQTRGDEAAGQLAARFAELVQAVVPERGGRLLELRGDEALVVFVSPRQAIRCALDLQARFVEETIAEPLFPFGVGIGIDSGEAVAVQDGYRGGALNMAARLCSLAGAGEVLATSEATHLARRIDGVDYVDRGRVQLKGIEEPPRVLRVRATGGDPAENPAFKAAVTQTAMATREATRRRQRRLIAVGATLVVIAAVAIFVGVRSNGGGGGLHEIGSNAVGAVSIDGSTLHRRVPVGTAPGPLAADAGSVWVANTADDTVSRIDLHDPTAPANTISVGHGPSGVALGGGAAWVTNADDRSVSRIDQASRKVVEPVPVGTGPSAVTFGADRVWVTNLIDDTVSVIDPASDKVIATIPVGAQPAAIAFGFGSVWVANSGSSTVSRIDPKTLLVIAAVNVGNGPEGVTIDPTGVWVTNALDDTATHIDQATNRVIATVPVGRDPTGAAASGDAVWVANSNSDTVSRIDPKKNRVVDTVKVGNAPQGVAVTKNDAWVSARGSSAQHVGGTLRIVAGQDQLDSLDPSISFTLFGWTILATTNDGLVTYRRTGGPAGAQIVPDLAAALPTLSDNDKTYAFRLRPGIRFSDGTPVKASDVRTSIERALRVSPQPTPYFQTIVGAPACKPSACDLTRGVVPDDATGVVTIHLTSADPEFLYKLALPFLDVVPPSTPHGDTGLGPHGGTGPYVITSGSKTRTVLTRNPWFHQWSAVAQPAGYPDRIEVTIAKSLFNSSAEADIAAVARGTKYDWTPDRMEPGQLNKLVLTQTQQLHPFATNGTHYYFLNTRERPFNDVRVRRAVNYAIDRNAIVRAFGGSLLSQATCQVVTPTISGYQPYCPYTVHPNGGGRWSEPDLAMARNLVREAHAQRAKVTVVARPDRYDVGYTIAATMRAIGLDAKVQRFPDTGDSTAEKYFLYVNDLSKHVQTGLAGWNLDFPEPSDVLHVLLSCGAILPDQPNNNLNSGAFCDRHIDAQMEKALQQQTSDSAAAGLAWSQIDRAVTDEAPWIFLEDDRDYDVLSPRTGDYARNTQFGVLIDQLWVQ